MSSDGRYLPYHTMAPPYDYSSSYPPPPASYDSSHAPPPPHQRTLRATSSQPHSPHQQTQYNQPPPAQYPPGYGAPPYMGQPPPQWSSEGGWASYNQSYPPPPPQSEGFHSGPGRSETVPSSSSDQRSYPPSVSSNSDSRRTDDRHPPPLAPAAPPKNRRHERDPSPGSSAAIPGTPQGLDFLKLLDSYRVILDGAKQFSGSPAAPPRLSPETMEQMLQSATHAVQILDSASSQSPHSADAHTLVDRDADETRGSPHNAAAAATRRQKFEEPPVQEGQTCLGCNATSTPEWRRGPMGPRTLCNACGLVYAKLIKKRNRESRTAAKTNGAGHGIPDDSGLASSGDGGSEDEDSYGSQDRRSEAGEGRD